MAIDKTVPNRLQTDADQRFLNPKIGEMVDAQNVTISEGGTSTGGVIKNVRGTEVVNPLGDTDRIVDGDPVRVIGSVSDSQRGYVYWFVADEAGTSQHAIYRQNVNDGNYELVLKSPRLNFDPDGFVKADVVNEAFQQDGVVETILYFTDGENEPRRINVDRAINGAFQGYSFSDLERMLSACKGAPLYPPIPVFETDDTTFENNFYGHVFQFATQYVYVDGEVSAISPYSTVAYPDSVTIQSLEDAGDGFLRQDDNVCVLNTRWSSVNGSIYNIAEVDKIRIFARDGNDSPLFIVDEFDANDNFTREVFGNDVEVFSSQNGQYRFYNDLSRIAVSQNEQNKLFDNVPFTAVGQSVSGNRLMYSNYTEGRPNHDVSQASITVSYSEDNRYSGESDYAAGLGQTIIQEYTVGANGDIKVDLLAGGGFTSASQLVPAGSRTILKFSYDAVGEVSHPTQSLLTLNMVDPDPTQPENDKNFTVELGNVTLGAGGDSVPIKTGIQNAFVTLIVVNDEDILVSQLTSRIKQELEGYRSENRFDAPITSGKITYADSGIDSAYTAGNVVTFDMTAKAYYAFDDISSINTTSFYIKPYISLYSPFTIEPDQAGDEWVWKTSSWVPQTSQSGADYDITSSVYLYDEFFLTTTLRSIRSFKAGSTHELGIVYYDRYNRSGNVNKIGSFYVAPFGAPEREVAGTRYNGASSITVNLQDSNGDEIQPPDWAAAYQFVYTGMSTYSDFFSYTTGGAYPARILESGTNNTTQEIDETSKRIYVSLKTLTQYQDQKKSLKNYSFTEGDKLRVIKYYDGNTMQFPRATLDDDVTPDTDWGVVEFDVVGMEYLQQAARPEGNDDPNKDIYNPIHPSSQHQTSHDPYDEHGGWFVVLEAPQIQAGSNTSQIKYPGFDWYSVVGQKTGASVNYPNGDAAGTTNHWGKRSVVEILTKREVSDESVYYEIGNAFRVLQPYELKLPNDNRHGYAILSTSEGDVYFRPHACRSAETFPDVDNPEDWKYFSIDLESHSVSDFFKSRHWSKGRPHVEFEEASTVRRYNGIIYSDAYAEDVANLSLSSFNGSLANFFSLESSNGACNYIGTFRDDYLLAFQENRVSRVPIKKDIITSPSGEGLVSLSTKVLNTPKYYLGDFGCGNNPESVLIKDGSAFFVDTSRRKVVRLTTEGIAPISETGIDSLFKQAIDDYDGNRIVSGYDPDENMYFVTLSDRGTYDGLTLGYNVGSKTWQSRYTFFPDMYADQNDTMYSAIYTPVEGDDNDQIFFSHTDDVNRNTFYGGFGASVVQIVSNHNPSMVKVFNAISLEGDSNAWVADPIVTDLNSEGQSLEFVEKEGAYYSFVTRDENGTKHITGVGTIDSVTLNTMTFDNRVNRNPIPYGAALRIVDTVNDEYDTAGTLGADVTFVNFADTNTINVDGNINTLFEGWDGSEIVAVSEATINGDPIRGHWAEITLTNNQAAAFELYCVNTHFADSKQNHALGQAVAKK